MKTLLIYFNGITIGVILEYCIRIEAGFLQAILLTALLLGMLIQIITDWNKN